MVSFEHGGSSVASDYFLGDCVDLVILGAIWEKERGRELRGEYSRGLSLL